MPIRYRTTLLAAVTVGAAFAAVAAATVPGQAALRSPAVQKTSYARPGHATPSVRSIVANGTFSCGTIVRRPTMSGTITWSPPYPRSGLSRIGVIQMSFQARKCLILSGRFRGRTIREVDVFAAFPIDPNLTGAGGCPFLPPPPTYIENLTLAYPGVNFGFIFDPSFATVQVTGGAFWRFTAGLTGGPGGALAGLVGGSFATTGATAQFRPVKTVPSQNCGTGITSLTLAPTSANSLVGF
jgi:hypothetical protein